MSYEKIKSTRYRCVCEAKKRGSDTELCGHIWETDSIPLVCALCKKRTWNGSDKRTEHFLTHKGKTLSVKQWASEIGVSASTIYQRLWRGWAIEDVLESELFTAGRHPKEIKQ